MASVTLEKAAKDQYVFKTSLNIAILGVVAVFTASFVYGLTFGVFSWQPLLSFLDSGNVPDALAGLGIDSTTAANLIISLSSTPVAFAALTASFPFLGAWIYIGVRKDKSTSVGLLSVALYGAFNLLLTFLFSGASFGTIHGPLGFIGFVIGVLIAFLYSFFVMGIGFNLAKIFKLRAEN